MAVTTIPWGDGSGDNIYLTYSASQGDQTVLVSSDANNGAARQKVITFLSTVGNISRSLTVSQEEGASLVSITWNNVCITYDDTAIGYQDTSPQYVQDGLVFWLDGIDKGEGANTWVEKKQGYVFENHGAVFNPDHVYLDGTAYLENATATTPLVADGTIEVVYQRESANGTVLVPTRPSGASYCGFGVVNNTIRWSVFSSSSRYTIPNAPALASVSLSADRSLGNGYALTQGSNSYLNQSNNQPSRVGVLNSNSNFFTGKIYCIRVYSRKLTEAEVLTNYAIDCQRFNFDWEDYITFEDATVEQICVSTWGDGTGLTKGKAKLIPASEVVTAFSGNTQIQKFNELRYFGFWQFNGNSEVNMFKDCTALTELTLPDTLVGRPGSNMIQNDTLLATLNLGNGRPSFIQSASPQLNYVINVKIKDIDQYIDLWRECTAFGWANVWARYESTGAHLILASTNQEITSVSFPSGRTEVPWHCFNNMKSITSVTLPSSVTEIKGYAFYGCSGLTSIPSLANVTAIGNNAFYGCSGANGDVVVPSGTTIGTNTFTGCSGLTNLSILSSETIDINKVSTGNTGNETGTFYYAGSISAMRNDALYGFATVKIDGSVTMIANNNTISNICRVLKIGGDFDVTANSYGIGPQCTSLEFVEINGNILCNGSTNVISAYFNPTNCIAHFGYDGLIAQFSSVGRMSLFMSKMQKVYVGDGSSASHDNAILVRYTSDTDWSAYTSKLDTWYNYVNSPDANPDFIN